jgi:hypothetical protein
MKTDTVPMMIHNASLAGIRLLDETGHAYEGFEFSVTHDEFDEQDNWGPGEYQGVYVSEGTSRMWDAGLKECRHRRWQANSEAGLELRRRVLAGDDPAAVEVPKLPIERPKPPELPAIIESRRLGDAIRQIEASGHVRCFVRHWFVGDPYLRMIARAKDQYGETRTLHYDALSGYLSCGNALSTNWYVPADRVESLQWRVAVVMNPTEEVAASPEPPIEPPAGSPVRAALDALIASPGDFHVACKALDAVLADDYTEHRRNTGYSAWHKARTGDLLIRACGAQTPQWSPDTTELLKPHLRQSMAIWHPTGGCGTIEEYLGRRGEHQMARTFARWALAGLGLGERRGDLRDAAVAVLAALGVDAARCDARLGGQLR